MPLQTPTIKAALAEHVTEVLPNRQGLAKLMQKQTIRLYLGVDPTSPNLHLGHAVLLRKLRQFQDLGHEVVLLFGTFTARIGDPSGKDKRREPLSAEQIKQNVETYKKQAGVILDISKTTTKYNHTWLAKLTLEQLLGLTSHFTTSQMLERDMFQDRMRRGAEIWLHELLYPLMQGYDSVAMDVDLEVGGTDQTFNMLVGRKLQKICHDKEKYVLTVPLLLGMDGRKMSKSFGNVVNLTDTPNDMYGKIMSLRDELIPHYFELATEVSETEIKKMKKKLAQGTLVPRDAKAKLAKEIVRLYHGKKKAEEAEHQFEAQFREKQLPQNIPAVRIAKKRLPLVDLLVAAKFAASKSEARRLVLQGGVKIDQETQKEPEQEIAISSGMIIQVGKRRFIQIQ